MRATLTPDKREDGGGGNKGHERAVVREETKGEGENLTGWPDDQGIGPQEWVAMVCLKVIPGMIHRAPVVYVHVTYE